jgi:hypothetical protein
MPDSMRASSRRWIVAIGVACAMTSVGCRQPRPDRRAHHVPTRATEDASLSHAFDTQMELRVLDRLQLDNFLRDREIRLYVIDGTVKMTGEVRTPLERERAGELVRAVPGVVDVSNSLTVRPPA